MVKIKWFIIWLVVSFFIGSIASGIGIYVYGQRKLVEAEKLINAANNDLTISKQTNNDLEAKLTGLDNIVKRLTDQINRGVDNSKELDNTINNAKSINDECRKLIDELISQNP
jgi:hypothetical protein